METKSKQLAINLFLLLGLGIIALIVLDKTTKIFESQPETIIKEVPVVVQQEAKPHPSEYPDFDALQKMKSQTVVEEFESWTPNSKKEPEKVKVVMIVSGGKLSKAYFLIRAVQEDKPLTRWESVYLILNYTGGHLFRPQSLKVPPSSDTTLLYALDDVPYLARTPYSEQITPSRANWFAMLEPNRKVRIETFISSLVPATLKEITLYYQCESDDSDCEVTLENQ